MENLDYPAIGQRIKLIRRKKKINQKEMAQRLNKSLRTVQKYETGEIEVSVAVVNQIAEILEVSSAFLLGYETGTAELKCLADIAKFLFDLETAQDIELSIEVKQTPKGVRQESGIMFNARGDGYYNAHICLFLEQWKIWREDLISGKCDLDEYNGWKERTLSLFAAFPVESVPLQEKYLYDEEEESEEE